MFGAKHVAAEQGDHRPNQAGCPRDVTLRWAVGIATSLAAEGTRSSLAGAAQSVAAHLVDTGADVGVGDAFVRRLRRVDPDAHQPRRAAARMEDPTDVARFAWRRPRCWVPERRNPDGRSARRLRRADQPLDRFVGRVLPSRLRRPRRVAARARVGEASRVQPARATRAAVDARSRTSRERRALLRHPRHRRTAALGGRVHEQRLDARHRAEPQLPAGR